MYTVVEAFEDKADNRFAYAVGDVYPRKGYKPSEERIEELATSKNVRKRALIKQDKPAKKTK